MLRFGGGAALSALYPGGQRVLEYPSVCHLPPACDLHSWLGKHRRSILLDMPWNPAVLDSVPELVCGLERPRTAQGLTQMKSSTSGPMTCRPAGCFAGLRFEAQTALIQESAHLQRSRAAESQYGTGFQRFRLVLEQIPPILASCSTMPSKSKLILMAPMAVSWSRTRADLNGLSGVEESLRSLHKARR